MKKIEERAFGSSQCNALMQALKDCGYNHVEENIEEYEEHDEYDIYAFLAETPKASLVVEVVDKLNEYGYVIRNTK